MIKDFLNINATSIDIQWRIDMMTHPKKTIGQKTPWAIKKLLPLCWSNIYSIQVKKDGKAVIWGKKALHSPHKELSWQDMSESRETFFSQKKSLNTSHRTSSNKHTCKQYDYTNFLAGNQKLQRKWLKPGRQENKDQLFQVKLTLNLMGTPNSIN